LKWWMGRERVPLSKLCVQIYKRMVKSYFDYKDTILNFKK
jgi:hypothetical protein